MSNAGFIDIHILLINPLSSGSPLMLLASVWLPFLDEKSEAIALVLLGLMAGW